MTRTDTDELADYVFGVKRKAWHRYSLMYWWWHAQRILNFVINRPLCFFGEHTYDGIFHTVVLDSGARGSVKRYRCRYCHKPSRLEEK